MALLATFSLFSAMKNICSLKLHALSLIQIYICMYYYIKPRSTRTENHLNCGFSLAFTSVQYLSYPFENENYKFNNLVHECLRRIINYSFILGSTFHYDK